MIENKACILLVEDEEGLNETLKLNLEMEGYDVTSAYAGDEALTELSKAHFDLMILDIMLPEIDGITVAQTVRLSNDELPILMLSAKNSGAVLRS